MAHGNQSHIIRLRPDDVFGVAPAVAIAGRAQGVRTRPFDRRVGLSKIGDETIGRICGYGLGSYNRCREAQNTGKVPSGSN